MPDPSAGTDNDSSSPLFPRSASYNHLPSLEYHQDASQVKRTFSETNLTHSIEKQAKLNQDSFTTGKEVLRRSSLHLSKGKSRAKDPLPTLPANGSPDAPTQRTENARGAVEPPPKPRSVSSAFANLARKPWISRSPSPSSRETKAKLAKSNGQPPSKLAEAHASGKDSSPNPVSESPGIPLVDSSPRRTDVLVKRNRRSGNFGTKPKNDGPNNIQRRASLQSLRAKVSMDRLSGTSPKSNDEVPPVPVKRAGQLPQLKVDPPRKKDELWSVFRGLDADFQKFQSKSSALKSNVIRSSLLSFFSRYANHPSNQCLRPEDLDRRINILNKWWTGLLEVLNGRNSQSLTGVDRPVFLEAIIGIMTRPEWRIPTSQNSSSSSSPTTPTVSNPAAPMSRSNTSLESTGTDFLIESIHHNIRNIFAQNLLSQIAYCIDKMSMRQTPASLVTFSGKTCAYAFFFCPGVADILVRLWNTSPDTLRRILGAFDLDRSAKSRLETSEYISSNFPPTLRSLCFTSHASLVRCLRQKTNPPLSSSHINWSGPWISRWSGRDTDLFFVFVKHFHILVAGFLSPGCERSKYVYVPGLISVHAQILTVLEHTLNKKSTPQSMENFQGPTSTTFDDFIDGADASASAMPIGAANSLRVMSENRLILLLKDVLADRSIQPSFKQAFVENFCAILKVATRKISLFDHNACFVLFDFVEELVSVIPPYCVETNQPDLLDWRFWLDVCKQMMESNNSLTEVRVFAFIYTVWDEINRVDEGKEALCLGILLHESFFYRYFNHWSPMVRSYFQRLLCWRLARYEGNPSSLDIRIYNTLIDRLGSVWNYFVFSQARAEKELTPPLSTAPCSPAPGRRILIIRNDYNPAPSMFVCLDNIIPPTSSQPQQFGNNGPFDDIDSDRGRSESPPPAGKKRWKSLKTIFSGTTNPKPGEVTPPGSTSEEPDFVTKPDTAVGASSNEARNENEPPVSKTQPKYTFRFSLQWHERAKWPSRDRRLFPPCLPIPAQLLLQSLRTLDIKQPDSSSASASNSISGTNSDDESESEGADMNPVLRTASGGSSNIKSTNPSASSRPNLTVITAFDSSQSMEETHRLVASKYAGRSLAEWALVVCECDNFFSRRRGEGVPSDDQVEIPILGVESFRK
ncbi:hypothetical protein FQN50_003476 [Emmonsiellopsis sp. PD_5]|nr:hypothetical protein FQN50_003476 [Emmonsiellopsis sp. PD_5]